MMATRLLPFFMLLLLFQVSACGFQVRGGVLLAPALEMTYVEAENRYDGIAPALRKELLTAGANLADSKAAATAIIRIVDQRSRRRVLAVGSGGRASEYELFEEVRFALLDNEGGVLLKAQTLRITRDMVFDETQLLGKLAEADDIRRQMRHDLSRQIITRIAYGMREQ